MTTQPSQFDTFNEYCETLSYDDRHLARLVMLGYCLDAIAEKTFEEGMSLVKKSYKPEGSTSDELHPD